ncbi:MULTISPECIES: AraC family transcriptional regulator [unclassified Ensifer]|uniref:helix-turn-helix transcriptional regulator n=1 Tax=unclassified Ensifer TaxID=2633371 RepID=UPI001AED71F6|nr:MULTISPECIES: AraC family transcriptional regulator [unclassified Ensifer]
MIRFSTDDIAPQDRFDQWREVRGKSLFGVTIELPAAKRSTFRGSFQSCRVGSAVASEMRASAYRVSRTEADIARVAGNSLCIAFQVKGGGLLDTGGDRAQVFKDGDMAISHSDLPYHATPGGHDSFHFRVLTVPFDHDVMLGRPTHDLFTTRYQDDAAFARAFRALFNAVSARHGELSDPQREVAHITRLALAARKRLAPGMPEVRAALRSGLRYAAEEIMARDKHQQKLTPAKVALELGISVRQLHVIFEHAELTFARTLATMRIAEARRLLVAAPAMSVTEVAYACGFDSLATFYRLFAGIYGMAPGESRATDSFH